MLLGKLAWDGFSFAYGLLSLTMTVAAAAVKGGVFTRNRRMSDEEERELALAQEQFWGLSNAPVPGFRHAFCTLATGVKMHYIVNESASKAKAKNVVIFVHGFPDSCLLWRDVLTSLSRSDTNNECTLIAVDLPGYGGSAGLDVYDAGSVLEAMTGFILEMRQQYLEDGGKVVIVTHDWGTIIATRLASEAGMLADRWILTAGIIPEHLRSNVQSLITSSRQMLHTFAQHPTNIHLLRTAIAQLRPIASQLSKSFYIFIFNLPLPFATYFATFGNYWFLRLTHRMQAGPDATGKIRDRLEPKEAANWLAAVGPGQEQLDVVSKEGHQYSTSVSKRVADFGMAEKLRLYREHLGLGAWEKSLETIIALSELQTPSSASSASASAASARRRRSSMGAALFDEGPAGALKAPATVIYGRRDPAFEPRLCLNGMSDYLGRESQVLVLKSGGHWLPSEKVGGRVLEGAVRMELEESGGAKGWLKRIEEAGGEVEVLVDKR